MNKHPLPQSPRRVRHHLMVSEHENLSLLSDLSQNLQTRLGPPLIEAHQDVIDHKRQRLLLVQSTFKRG